MTAEPQLPPVDPAVLRTAMRVAISKLRKENADRDYRTMQSVAFTPFAQIRRRGFRNLEITLPGGAVAGLIAIKTGGRTVHVDEDELLGVIASDDPEAFEDYIDPALVNDPRLRALVAKHLPELVRSRVRPDVRAQYEAELAENNGRVIDRETGDRVKVADITYLEATGDYSVTWSDKGKGMILLQEALDAGLIGIDGDVVPPPHDAAASAPAETPSNEGAKQEAASTDDPAAPETHDADDRLNRALKAGGTRTAPKHAPTDEQAAIVAAIRDTTDDIAIEAGAGTGKALRYDQPVLTPGGWRQIGDLGTGDNVIGSDGRMASVTGVYGQGVRDLFEVVISDGTIVVADGDHLWITTTTKDRDRHRPARARTTTEIAATIRTPAGRINHYLPMLSGPVEMPVADLPLDPYVLGVLLGDGGLSGAMIIVSTPDDEILAAVKSALPAGVRAIRVEGSACDYRITASRMTVPGRRGCVNPVIDILRDLGLRGSHSNDKHIPGIYLYASASQRLALLQGLLDTDGSAAGICAEFSTASKQLAGQVAWLAQSFGGTASLTERQSWHTYKGERRAGQPSYRMRISLPADVKPFRLRRKLDALTPRTRFAPYRQIVQIRPVPAAEAVCISVDVPDQLYLTAGCIPTHNTSVLQMAAQEYRAKGYYLVFGRANAAEAKRKFPRHVQAMTTSSLAMAAVGRPYRHRLDGGQVPAREVAQMLRISMPLGVDDRILAPQQQARLVNAMVKNYAQSADIELGPQHCPVRPGLDTPTALATLRHNLLPFARKAWADLISTDGRLKFDHYVYVKLWQLTDPQFPVDFCLLDEAQDTDEVVLAVFNGQRSARRIVTGDSSQAIHEWRGAVNALAQFPGARLKLSQSFRFGSAIASEANKWLTVLGSDMHLTGSPRISSMVRDLPQSAAVLCRTNGTAMAQAMQLLDEGRKVAIVGGGGPIRDLAEAAISLKQGRGSIHPELMAFKTWAEVQDHVEHDPSGQDLKVFVKLIDDHGPEGIIACIDRLADENDCDTAISTAHKSKGLEWDSVRIADDFHEPARDPEKPGEDPEIPPELARLAYVAVTRARLSLDRSGLAWIDKYLPAGGDA